MLRAAEFKRRFFNLILMTWMIPPVFGLGFILFIGILSPEQMFGILLTPLEPLYIFGWMGFAVWYFPRHMRPVTRWLENTDPEAITDALNSMRGFPLKFWTVFLIYLLLAPGSVILSAEYYTDFAAQPVDWFRIHLVALIVSIIVGLPIFFLILDLFGQALGELRLTRPHVTIKTKVFLIGALVPLLIDTMLVQYYWTRTDYFTFETFVVWLVLELLAVAGSLIFVRSISQSLSPLQNMIESDPTLMGAKQPTLLPMSTDELGVLTTGYRQLLHEQYIHNEILALNNRLLRCAGQTSELPALLDAIVTLCEDATGGDMAFLLLKDKDARELLCVSQTGSAHNPEGHFRLSLKDLSLAAWVYQAGRTVALGDASQDPRISECMREQFRIGSALAVPLKSDGGTIGVLMTINHEIPHQHSQRDVALLEGLAHEAALVITAARVNDLRRAAEQELRRHREELEQLVEERTAELSAVNEELESFSYSVSHDLRAPLRAIDGFSKALAEDYTAVLDEAGLDFIDRIRNNTRRMTDLINDLLSLSRLGRMEMKIGPVDLSELASEIIKELKTGEPERQVEFNIQLDGPVQGDARLLRIALENLLGNAWKYSRKKERSVITLGKTQSNGETAYFVKDNGAGFNMKYTDKLFGAFQRLHQENEFEGTGIGLATVARIIHRHGGRVWAESAIDQGAMFYFTLGAAYSRPI